MYINNRQNSIYAFAATNLLASLKQLFKIKKAPLPWTKALGAAICAGFPILIGILTEEISLGLIGEAGSFSYLYVFNEPYAYRAKKMFFIAMGMSLSFALGTLTAPYPWLVILAVGMVGAIATFLLGLLKILGPAAVFFVLSFLLAAGMPVNPSEALTRAGIVFISGILAWIVSMIGYFFNPHGPEIKALKEVYLDLAKFSQAIGSEDTNNVRHATVIALRKLDEILLAGYIPWKDSSTFNRFFLLNEQANKLFLEMVELSSKGISKLPNEFNIMITELSHGIELRNKKSIKLTIPPGKVFPIYDNLLNIIYETKTIINSPLPRIYNKVKPLKPSLRMKFIQALDMDSIVFINALKYGIVLSISAIVALYLPFDKPYWIPLSCAAAMSGSTIMSTFHRTIQRSFGTLIGTIIAAIILVLRPEGAILLMITMSLTALIELCIVKNYALAAIFITPNALLLAQIGSGITDPSYFVSARIIDTLVGTFIGLIGTCILSRRSASSRLPNLMMELIHSQSQLLVRLTSNKITQNTKATKAIKEKMQMNLMNFKLAYSTALEESSNQKNLEILWPAIFSIEHISYLLDKYCTNKGYLNLSDEDLSKLLLSLEAMVVSIHENQLVKPKRVPILNEIPIICGEINQLQEALNIGNLIIEE